MSNVIPDYWWCSLCQRRYNREYFLYRNLDPKNLGIIILKKFDDELQRFDGPNLVWCAKDQHEEELCIPGFYILSKPIETTWEKTDGDNAVVLYNQVEYGMGFEAPNGRWAMISNSLWMHIGSSSNNSWSESIPFDAAIRYIAEE